MPSVRKKNKSAHTKGNKKIFSTEETGLTVGLTEQDEGLTVGLTEQDEGLTVGLTEQDEGLTVGLTEPAEGLTVGLTEQDEGLTVGLTEPAEQGFMLLAEACKLLQISRTTAYKRMTFLQIKPWKQGKCSYLDSTQFSHLKELNEHLKKHNSFEGYPVPEKSGPWKESFEVEEKAEAETLPEVEASTEDVEPRDSPGDEVRGGAMVLENLGAMAQTEAPGAMTPPADTPPGQDIPMAATSPHLLEEELNAIDIQAQRMAAVRYAATHGLSNYYAQTGKFTDQTAIDLIRQQQQQTNQQWTSAHTNADPNALTQLLIQRAQGTASVAGENS